jgi:hypothetical protein
MDYTVFFQKTLTDLGYDVVGVWNAFDPPHNHHHGWPLKLPDIEFGPRTLLVMPETFSVGQKSRFRKILYRPCELD